MVDQKYQIGNDYGSIVWDISLILKNKQRFLLKEYSVDKLAANNPFHGDREYAMQTDISQPMIVVSLVDGTDKVIDGNHRLYRCVQEGVSSVKAYYLDYAEHHQYIVDFDEETYWNVVNHWGRV